MTDAPITQADRERIRAAALERQADLTSLAERRGYCSGFDDLYAWADEAAAELRQLASGAIEEAK